MPKGKLFELGSALDDSNGWSADNKAKSPKKQEEIQPVKEHSLALHMQKRKGKPVSIIGEFYRPDDELKALCKKIKKSLGVGGTCKEGFMEFQGECRDKLRIYLKDEGYRVKN